MTDRYKRVGLKDGAYQVTTAHLCAGFVVRNGHVRLGECAPILWNRLENWQRSAVWICDAPPSRYSVTA